MKTPYSIGILATFLAGQAFGGNFFHNVSPTSVPLPGGVVYYQFDPSLTTVEQQVYLNGLREWELAGNIHFIPYSNQTNWILFKYTTNAQIDTYDLSSVPWTVTISVLSRSQVCHEMGHVLGLEHENIRVDKTNYVTVLTNNITPPTNISWFTIDPTGVTNGVYDYESVMHLANDFSSINPPTVYTQVANAPYQSFQPFMGNLALSAGDRAAIAYLYGPPTVPLTNVVTNTADAGSGSLRAAIYYSIDHPGTTVRFNIPTNDPGYSNGVYTISLTGYLPPLVTNGTVIDGSTQPGFASNPIIVINGSQIIPEAYIPGTTTGLYLFAGNCQLKSLSFQNFDWNGVTISYPGATNNTISGCWFGLDHTGTNAAPNAYQGILIYNGASSNLIGGTSAAARNVLSGNTQYGVYIAGTNTTGNKVYGNYVGVDPGGTKSVPNVLSGVTIQGGAYSNIIGGTSVGQRNVLSGNTQYGFYIGGTGTSGNTVSGNYIGTDATGAVNVNNTYGGAIVTDEANSNLIGPGNIISGNTAFGLWVDSDYNTVQGNWIGLNAAGNAALPNYSWGMYLIYTAQSNSVIGNVISGNYSEGLRLVGPTSSGNLVQNNYIGTDPGGTYSIPNYYAGLTFYSGAASNTASGNVISGNGAYGVILRDSGTVGNVVDGNYIGLAANGVAPLNNGGQGIFLTNGAQSNIMGLNLAGSGTGNRIACNGNEGVAIYDSITTGNTIRGNNIFSNGNLGINLVGGTENSYGVTANHLGGVASGPNDLQNYPIITNAATSGANMLISGTLNSTASRNFLIDCYRNLTADPSGSGEGQFYVGSVAVTTDGSGNAAFSLTAVGNFVGEYFSATAAEETTGDTSEFSQDLVATNGPAPPSFVGPYTLTGAGFSGKIAVTINQSYRLQAATNLATNPIPWMYVTNFTASATNYNFLDASATNLQARFYRVTSP